MSGPADEEDGAADRREPGSSSADDLSGRTLPQLQDLHRERLRRMWLACGVLVLGVLLATLPTGTALAYPATLLVTGGVFAVPIAAYLLRSVHREVVARELQASLDRSEDAAS